MSILVTDWRSRVTPLDARVQGDRKPVPWLYGSNAPVYIDARPLLAPGESVVNLTSSFRRLPAVGEGDYADATPLLEGSPTQSLGIVKQVLQNLERGRVYRWEILFGPADNRRGQSLLVECVE